MGTAVVLLSGGLDSATVAAMARQVHRRVVAVVVSYGQRHSVEIAAAHVVATALQLDHVYDVSAILPSRSALAPDATLCLDRSLEEIASGGIPTTYVPARNSVMLALALGVAELEFADVILTGFNAVDYPGYPDCRPEFVAAAQQAARLASARPALRIETPIIAMTKADIIRRGVALNVPYHLTVSCYDATQAGSCGRCDSCVIRRDGFSRAGVVDPTVYR